MIFDPNDVREITLSATFSDTRTTINEDYAQEREAYEHAIREREYGSLMRQKYGVCG